jgi:hypothetical protein
MSRSALHTAVISSDVKRLRELLALELLAGDGAAFDQTDCFGSTPLHFAASRGNEEACVLLLSVGANAAIRSGNGKTAFELALQQKKWGCVFIFAATAGDRRQLTAAADALGHPLPRCLRGDDGFNSNVCRLWIGRGLAAAVATGGAVGDSGGTWLWVKNWEYGVCSKPRRV